MKVFIYIVFSFIPLALWSQTWLPVGARWYFDHQEMESFEARGYSKFEVVKDTLVAGKDARLISVMGVRYTGDTTRYNPLIEYEEEGRVYVWNGSDFQLKYDINLGKGDTLLVKSPVYDSISPVFIDSVGYEPVDTTDTLKVQWVHYWVYIFLMEGDLDSTRVVTKIMEKIGNPYDFFFPSGEVGDVFTYYGLRCYLDDSLYYRYPEWKVDPEVACDSLIYTTIVGKHPFSGNIRIYPNPACEWLMVEWPEQTAPARYEVIGPTGRILLAGELYRRKRIGLQGMKGGLYWIRITAGKSRKTIPFVVR